MKVNIKIFLYVCVLYPFFTELNANLLYEKFKKEKSAYHLRDTEEKKLLITKQENTDEREDKNRKEIWALDQELKKVLYEKKDIFETTESFFQRKEEMLKAIEGKSSRCIRLGAKCFSAGFVEMLGYDADHEKAYLKVEWNQKIGTLFPVTKRIKKVYCKISIPEAKYLFSSKKRHYFHLRLSFKNKKLSPKSILLYDKYLIDIAGTGNVTQNNIDAVEKLRPSLSAQKEVALSGSVAFHDSGIYISVKYRNMLSSKGFVRITAEMINRLTKASRGGLTLSFPEIGYIRGAYKKGNFGSTSVYDRGSRVYNKISRENMHAQYAMIEGWQKTKWRYGEKKYFSIDIYPPEDIKKLTINIRGILWLGSHRRTAEAPKKGYDYDQQGFSIKKYEIALRR